jgi:heme-degrading monooxygenase HmoA
LTSVVTIFRNRLRPGATGAYGPVATEMTELARSMPGFVDSKTFTAPDGERVTVVTFADRESHNAWRDHPLHRAAQQRGIDEFYETYGIQVADTTYEHTFTR